MSLERTRPRWCPLAVATNRGWENSNTGELLVSFRNLKNLMDAEIAASQPVEPQKEVIMETPKEEVQEVKLVLEQTVKKPKKNQKIIAEVVEYDLNDKEVIGE